MAATKRQHPAGHRPVPVRDQDNSISCLSCGFTFAWGDTGRPIGYGSLPRGIVHQIQAHDPFASLDDDEFAPEGGCRAWNDLRRTREQLQRRADREMRALWGGGRR